MQAGFGADFDLAALPEAAVDAVLSKPWASDGSNFSDRIWKDKATLLRNLQDELTQGLVRGDTQDTIVRKFNKRMGTSLSSAGRLIATESAFFAAKGECDNMKELGVEKYQFVATLDSRTSDICRSMDMKVIPMKDFQPGVTAPPLHCWCRSCTVPYMEDMPKGFRAARDEKGYTTHVPDMTYRDWKAIYVDKTQTLGEWEKAHEKPKVPALKAIPFTPAKTIKEAQEYAKQFIAPDTLAFKGTANYSGLSIDMANEINNALTQIYGNLDIPKLHGIKAVSPNSAQGKKAFPGGGDAVASYNAAGQGIFLNKDVLKNRAAFDAYKKRAADAWDFVMKNINKLFGAQRILAERYKSAGRDLV